MVKRYSEEKYFKRLNRFTTVAVYLTTIMLTYLCLSSFISGAVSGSDTKKAMGMLISVFGIENPEPTSLKAYAERGGFHYDGDEVNLKTVISPENAKAYPVTYASSNEDAVSVKDGILSYHKKGSAKITVTIENDSKLSYSFYTTSYGQNPTNAKSVTVKNSPKVGDKSSFTINGGKTSDSVATYTSSDSSVASIVGKTVYFVNSGSVVLRALFKDESFVDIPVEVAQNSSFVTPKKINFVENATFLSGEKLAYNGLIASLLPENADNTFTVSSSDSDIVAIDGKDMLMKNKGSAILTFTSVYDPSITSAVTVTVEKIMPTDLEIICSDFVVVNSSINLSCKHYPVDYPDDVVWTVVKGDASITGNKLKARFFGKITVRCQSKLNPDLCAEKVINVKLYSNFYSFVRKVLGHFSLFAILGFGVWGCTFLLTNFLYSLILSPAVCFISATLCEMFQACTPGRYFTMADVFLNFCGTLTGCLIAIISVGVFCLIFRLASKARYQKLKRAYNYISVKTVFCKHKKK